MLSQTNRHSFYIPVMGTGFTIDTPLKVAKYGISSVISVIDDTLIEQMRKFHCNRVGEPYTAIKAHDEDARARRITAYLNLLDRLIYKQVAELQASPFTHGSEITRYYEMLPKTPLKQRYVEMLAMKDPVQKQQRQNALRQLATPGSIDVNIMTKLNADQYRQGIKLPPEFSDALAALRGYANSTLSSSVVFSAGFNPRLYGYLSKLSDFSPDKEGNLKKKVILKVTDYRSAFIQGKYLAKRGIWVSEYRIESAINCGGHAFANDGHLMGPILEEFKMKKQMLVETLHEFYRKALNAKDSFSLIKEPLKTNITAQGGIGTHEEHVFLLKNYELESLGWGTPFLLVPEAVNLDTEHQQKLINATEKEVQLSENSPMGIPFWMLSNSASEEMRRQNIEKGKPGSACPKRFIKTNTEFTKLPICTASSLYQNLKLGCLAKKKWTTTQLEILKKKVLSKSCLCCALAASATKHYGIDSTGKIAVCPGPNIVNFCKIATLKEMLDHIYGRAHLFINSDRPHFFIKELMLHIDYLKKEAAESLQGLASRTQEKLCEVRINLCKGIDYYQKLAKKLLKSQQENFNLRLNLLKKELECITI